MTRSSTKELISYDPEIERFIRLRRKEQTSSSQGASCKEMENQEVEDINPLGIPPPVHVEEQLDEVAPRPAVVANNFEIKKPPVAANNFEIRTDLIQTIQQSCIFTGDTIEDPHSHSIDFLELVETAKYNGVPPEAIKLRLFPFSLKGDAKTWLRSLPQGSITTWDQMTQKFLNKYFSPAKTTKLRQDISNFLLKPSARNVIDAAAGGSVMGKTTEEALQLLNEISENAIQWPSERVIIKNAAMVNTQQSNHSEACDMCGGNHQNHECQATNQTDEQVNVIGYKSHPFGSPMAQKHPGFQWSNPNGAENTQSFQKQQVTDEKMETQNSSLKNLETQLSQLTALMSEKIQGPLPSNTEKNPKEHLKAITLRSGKELDKPYADRQEKNQTKQQVDKGKNFKKPSEPSKEKEIKNKEEKVSEKMVDPPIHINIPFTDALLQMPSYAKFLKEILSSKRKLEEVSVVMLTEKCSAILQNKLPQKLGDPDSFTIPCTLGGVYFEKALCDSGASINLMSFSIFRKLDLGEMKDIDFIVLEMKECPDESIILGRPFLDIVRAIIDFYQGQLILRVDEERVIFDMQKILRFSGDEASSSCFSIDMISDLADEFKDDQLILDSMKRCLTKSGTTQDDDPAIRREAEILKKDSKDKEMQSEEV
ncbi:uncharacterized protein [Nicotiana sylvestris]|uniref:uncharacterized protein n=1 Tax=Nicotiana sylvestris TaxID=4096 RepID=UPI00388C8B76